MEDAPVVRPQPLAGYRADVRLEPLSIFHWSYEEDARVDAPGYAILSAYDSEEGIGYGEGRGTATGPIEGTVVWSNYPRRRTDGRMLPNVRGLVTTHDGHPSCSSFGGARSSKATSRDGRTWSAGSSRITHDVVCIAEGTISAEGMEIHIYAGINEMPA